MPNTAIRKQLDKAERYLATAMYRGIVGLEGGEAEDSARQKRIEFVNQYGNAAAVDHLYGEAYRYEDM